MRVARHSLLGAGKTLGWAGATPVLDAIPRPKNTGGRSSPTRLQARSEVNRVKEVRIASCSFVFTTFFTRSSPYSIHPVRLSTSAAVKVTVEKTPKRAGATPLFRLPAAQKVRGVAPALRHGKSVPHVFSTVTGSSEKTKFACAR